MSEHELEPASIMGDMLTTLLLQAYDRKRFHVDTWEARGCRYLLREMDAGKSVGNLWMANFLKLNRGVITAGGDSFYVDFNLRAFRESQNPA
ncbi:hypothetical protein UFOVP399_21 [uncultured Caudovirales phage]|uniref:Uncharacterized protein n=1 Tax=uncultured Caudovirales phage TaxID=2100421 RepID=A0A6J5M741_9CAUD|nr:hypothetical protein UFOVP399_21 [uncultured Caudovirales phage]